MSRKEEDEHKKDKGRFLLVVLSTITIVISTIEMFLFDIFSGEGEYIYWYLISLGFSVYLFLNKKYILFTLFMAFILTVPLII